MQPLHSNPMLNRASANAKVQELATRHDTVLAARKRGDLPIGWSTSTAYLAPNVDHLVHSAENGSPAYAQQHARLTQTRRIYDASV